LKLNRQRPREPPAGMGAKHDAFVPEMKEMETSSIIQNAGRMESSTGARYEKPIRMDLISCNRF
jgi:hypothetical protein